MFYWGVYFIVIIAQAFYTFSSMNQIRLEEVIESARSVWWFENHLVWNGGYSSLGWAFIQAFVANLFGFNFYNAKFIKLFIEIIGYFCLAVVLKRYLGEKKAWLPLLIIGFSPTFLYFNSLQLSVGTEVSLFFILLYILETNRHSGKPRQTRRIQNLSGRVTSVGDSGVSRQVGIPRMTKIVWSLAMLAWMTYFGFIFYLPILLVYYLYLLLKQVRPFSLFVSLRGAKKQSLSPVIASDSEAISMRSGIASSSLDRLGTPRNDKLSFIFKNLTISFIIFILPLVAMFFYIKNRQLLLYDPALHRGLFRSFAEVSIKPDVFLDTFQRLTNDLFIRSSSYYFESKKVEFSDYYPIVSIIIVGGILFVAFKKKKRLRPLILSLVFFLFAYFFLISLIGPKTLGGMRRGTVLLVLFYFLFTIAWFYILNQKKQTLLRYGLIGAMCLLLIHHLLVYPENIENIKKPSVFREKWWFNTDTPPNKVLQNLIDHITKTDVIVPCWHTENQRKECAGLSLIYPSISLACKHNRLKCNKLYSYDYDSQKTTLINIDYWGQQTNTEP